MTTLAEMAGGFASEGSFLLEYLTELYRTMKQVVLSYLPGYMWVNGTLVSTGAAIPPTQHMDPETGDIKFYVRPLSPFGSNIGMFISRQGLIDAIARGKF